MRLAIGAADQCSIGQYPAFGLAIRPPDLPRLSGLARQVGFFGCAAFTGLSMTRRNTARSFFCRAGNLCTRQIGNVENIDHTLAKG